MNRKLLLISIGFILLIQSCSEKFKQGEDLISKDDLKTIAVSGLESSEKIRLTDLISELSVFPLELPNGLIGAFRQLQISEINNRVYVADENFVYIFNLEGDYIATINSIGDSFNEYKKLFSIDIDSDNGNLYVYDQGLTKIVVFDKNGKFLSYVKFNFLGSTSFAYLGSNLFSLNFANQENISGLVKNLVVVDESSTILNAYINQVKNIEIGWYNYWRSGDYLNYAQFLNDTIYGFSEENKLIAKYAFDFGEYTMPEINGVYDSKEFFFGGKYAKYAQGISGILENDNFLLFRVSVESKGKHIYYNKINNEVKAGYFNDDLGAAISPSHMKLTNDKLYGYSEASNIYNLHTRLREHLGEDEYQNLLLAHPNLAQVVKGVKNSDLSPPYLFIMNLKM